MKPRRQVDGPSRLVVKQIAPRPAQAATVAAVEPVFAYNPKRRHRRSWRPTKKVVIVILLLVGVVGLFFGAKILLATNRIISRNSSGGAPALSGNIDPTKLRGEGDGRVNILILGIGGAGHEGGTLSDTMMVVSIDPRTKDVAMLGIPRDLYVPIPGYGSTKINAAHAYGESSKYPGGGPALAKKTVEKVLGVPIHYFARVDFDGFKKAVDSAGGVDIDVKTALYDEAYPDERRPGNTKVLSIKAGMQHMNGARALEYSRSRHSTSDFDRARRQQEVLQALRNKALSLQTLTDPRKISSLIDVVGDHFKTDFQLFEMKKLAEIAAQIDETKIINKVLDTTPEGLLVFGNIDGAGSVEIPKAGIGDFSEIQELVHSIFVDNYLKDENARIVVQNGTTKNGLATTVGNLLKNYQYNVIKTVTADNQNYATSLLYDYTGGKKPYSIRYLENRFGVKAVKATPPAATNGVADETPDIKIIIGADYRVNR